jgi:SAM-dependent methyltransferase
MGRRTRARELAFERSPGKSPGFSGRRWTSTSRQRGFTELNWSDGAWGNPKAMAQMNRFGRWLVNRRTEARGRRVLSKLGDALHVPSSATVLELGTGGGGLLALLQDRYRPARLVGTDFDPAQVEAARGFLTRRWGSLPPSVELRRADALQLPFEDGCFDLVFAMMMLHHVEEHLTEYKRRPQALKEVRRVLRPGGALVYSEIMKRPEIRASLADLGFRPEFAHKGWRADLGIYLRPS